MDVTAPKERLRFKAEGVLSSRCHWLDANNAMGIAEFCIPGAVPFLP